MNSLRILYGIQCTGNGHLSRSREIINYLNTNYSDNIESIDICISGDISSVNTTDLNVKYSFKGLGFNTDNGRVSVLRTIKELEPYQFIKTLFIPDLKDYDIIISDFEPVTCWAGLLRNRKVLGIGNHYKFLSNKIFLDNLKPNYLQNKVLTKLISPVSDHITFDYIKDDEKDFFPIIRGELRVANITNSNFYICYLSSISISEQIKFFSLFPNHIFYIFHNDIEIASDFENICLRPINKQLFTDLLSKCKGVICHTGFQLTSECLFLGKKLLIIPIKNQIEQIYNTRTLNKLGVLSSENFNISIFDDFFQNDYSVKLNYMNEMKQLSEKIISYRS